MNMLKTVWQVDFCEVDLGLVGRVFATRGALMDVLEETDMGGCDFESCQEMIDEGLLEISETFIEGR